MSVKGRIAQKTTLKTGDLRRCWGYHNLCVTLVKVPTTLCDKCLSRQEKDTFNDSQR